MILKNQAAQGIYLFAYNVTSGAPDTGDAANITGHVSKDGGAAAAFGTANPTEIGGGVYWQPLAQGETNANALACTWSSTTAGVQVDPVLVLTDGGNTPANAGALLISASGHVSNVDTLTTYAGNTPQTGDCFARLGAPAGASIAADLAEIEAETDGIAAIPTNPYTGTPPTAAQIATAVWQDATAGDFTTAGSIGKSLGNAFTALGTSVFTVAALANAPTGGGGNVTVGGYASGQDPATLVLGATAASWNTAGTVGAKINAAGGAADPLTNPVPGSYASGTAGAALGKIGSGQITTVSPVAQSGAVTIIQGDSYQAADGRALAWTDAAGTWPNLTGGSFAVTLYSGATAVGVYAGSVPSAGVTHQTVQLALTSAQTTALTPGGYRFKGAATLADGDAVTLIDGTFQVNAN